jgi:hypothetical protein
MSHSLMPLADEIDISSSLAWAWGLHGAVTDGSKVLGDRVPNNEVEHAPLSRGPNLVK